MDKCADPYNDCAEYELSRGSQIFGCSGDYIAVPALYDEFKYKCCLTDDDEVSEVLNASTENNTRHAIAVPVWAAVLVLLTFIQFHYATEKIRNGTAQASVNPTLTLSE